MRWTGLGLVVVLVLGVVTFFRYDIKPHSVGYYKLDRWTGKVYVCSPLGCGEYRNSD